MSVRIISLNVVCNDWLTVIARHGVSVALSCVHWERDFSNYVYITGQQVQRVNNIITIIIHAA